jgi:hypothetical protein
MGEDSTAIRQSIPRDSWLVPLADVISVFRPERKVKQLPNSTPQVGERKSILIRTPRGIHSFFTHPWQNLLVLNK